MEFFSCHQIFHTNHCESNSNFLSIHTDVEDKMQKVHSYLLQITVLPQISSLNNINKLFFANVYKLVALIKLNQSTTVAAKIKDSYNNMRSLPSNTIWCVSCD